MDENTENESVQEVQEVKEESTTVETTSHVNETQKDDNKVMGVLSYLGLLVLIPYLTVKDDPEVRKHSIQGMNLLIIELIGIVLGFIPFLGAIASFVIGLYTLVVSIMGIINVCNGEYKELPLLNYFYFIKQ